MRDGYGARLGALEALEARVAALEAALAPVHAFDTVYFTSAGSSDPDA